jgi:hypothetical protein
MQGLDSQAVFAYYSPVQDAGGQKLEAGKFEQGSPKKLVSGKPLFLNQL